MKYFFFLPVVLLLSAATFTACHDHDDENDVNDPVVDIESPTENASIQGAVDIRIHVTDESLHEMKVTITRDADGVVLSEDNPSVHDKTEYHYEKSFSLADISSDTPMTITVTVEDHSEHKVVKTVKFIAKP